MARNLQLAVDLDLRDEETLLCQDYAEYNPHGVRSLLAALNLQSSGASPCRGVEGRAKVFDFEIFRATGSHSLAALLGEAL